MMPDCLEGYIIEYSRLGDRVFFMVKGYEHPEGYYITVPYRTARYRIEDPYEWLRGAAPWMLSRVDCMPREVPLLPRASASTCIDPARALELRWSSLPAQAKRLLNALDFEWAGLTGSWALGFESRQSDVDLLLYGPSVYEYVVEAYERGILRPCGARGDRLAGRAVGLEDLYSVKLVEACTGGLRVTLRILRSLEPQPCRRRRPLGVVRGVVELVDVGESYLVPARYKAMLYSVEGVVPVILETWRTRYQELPPGTYWLEGEAWVEDGAIIVSPDLGGELAPAAWSDSGRPQP